MKPSGFGKKEKLKSRKEIEALYATGKSYAVFPIRVKYQLLPLENAVPVQAGVSVSKRHFKRATDRNRLKRLLREAYRLQKSGLLQTMEEKKLRAVVFFMYTGKSLTSFAVVYKTMTACLHLLQQKALAHEITN